MQEYILQNVSEEPVVIFERERIVLPFNEKLTTYYHIYSYIKQLQKEMSELKQQVEQLTYRKILDRIAEKEVKSLLKLNKLSGFSKISIVEIVDKLHLPAKQIEKILDKLEKEGLVSESHEYKYSC